MYAGAELEGTERKKVTTSIRDITARMTAAVIIIPSIGDLQSFFILYAYIATNDTEKPKALYAFGL
ncbi:MAG: hypothetical protein K6G82_04215 [Ruminococcus sp.]|nr:hypothetical protein [Ruminococcus sp.]